MWLVGMLLAMPSGVEGRASGDEPDVLFLITERVVDASGETEETRFWWSNPSAPEWTETDRRLTTALDERGIGFLSPEGETRISRIYRRPDLSTNNAAALASILGARRIVVGRVTYRRVRALTAAGLVGVDARASMKVIDVTASEPEVLRDYRLGRSVYVPSTGTSTSESSGLDRARERLVPAMARLLDQTLSIVSGEVGVESDEPLLTFYGLERAAALDAIRRVIEELDPVESTGVRWAAEGVVALELNPGDASDTSLVRRAAEVLRDHSFEPLRLKPRTSSSEATPTLAFDVRITGTFEPTRRESRRDTPTRGETP
jgi:hypothetical protein